MTAGLLAPEVRPAPSRHARAPRWARAFQPTIATPMLLAVIAAAATWIATRHGPGLSPDAVTYISAARNLAAGHGYVDLTGRADTTFAPGFSALLAVGQRAGLTVLDAARLLNAACFAAIVLLTWVLVRRNVPSRRLALATTALVAVSPALLNVTAEAWSEPLFCVLLLGFIVVLGDALAAPRRSTRLAALAGVVAGAACLVRYAAVALILVGVLVLLAPHPHRDVRDRLRQAGLFAVAAVGLPLVWILRNSGVKTQYLLGPRVPSPDSLWNLTGQLFAGIAGVFAPRTATVLWVLLALPVALVVLIGIGVAVRDRRTAPVAGTGRDVWPLASFIVVYLGSVLVAGKVSGASVEVRTIMPIYVPAAILGAWLSWRAWQWLGASTAPRRRLQRAAPAFACLVLTFYVGWFAASAWTHGSTGRGYAAPSTVASPLARAVKDLPAAAVVVSNAPWALYFASGHEPILPQPGPLVPAASLVPPTVDQLVDTACSRPVYVAWYGADADAGAPPVPAQDVTPVRRLADGTLYALDVRRGDCI